MKWYWYIILAVLLIILGVGLGYLLFSPKPQQTIYVSTPADTIIKIEKQIDTIKIKQIEIHYKYIIDSIYLFNIPPNKLLPELYRYADTILQ